jgi:hypothetical protein
MGMGHVFISYSKKDQDYALRLAQALREQGFNVWIDTRSLHSSADWLQSIVLAIWQSDAFIILLTPRSDQSKWVQREIAIADQRDIPMFPLLLEGDINTPNWSIFIRTQYKDVRNGQLPDADFYDELAKHAPRSADGGVDVTNKRQTQSIQAVIVDPEFQKTIADSRRYGVENDLVLSKTLRLRPLILALLLMSVVGLVAVGLALLSNPTPSPTEATDTPAPVTASATDATITERPPMTFTPLPTRDPAAQPADLETLNAWRVAQGWAALTDNPNLSQIASSHLSYLASQPLDSLNDIPLYQDENGNGLMQMPIYDYGGDAQMFVYPPSTTAPTLADLIALLDDRDPNGDMQRSARDGGLARRTSPDTGMNYWVLILGAGEGGTG